MFTELIEPGREEHFETAFNGIQELGLDDTFLSWIEITALSNCFSSLRSLSASSNDFVSLGVHEPPSSLTSLTLERNKFTSLQALSPVAGLRNLRTLSLKYNFISSILKDEKSVTAGSVIGKLEFSDSLTYIDLSYNSIGSWSFINEMEKVFPSLSGLRLSHNPLYESGKTANGDAMGLDEGFMLTLARLGNLRQLNFSNITQQERTNAEMYYLSRIAKELAAVPEKEEESITAQHKRYAELSELYGPPIITRVTPSTINPNSLEARLITFKFYQNLPQTSSLNTAETTTHTKEVPRGFDVYRLKGMVGKLFRQRPMGLKLVWETGEWDPVAGAHKDDWDSSDEETEEDGTDERGKWIRREVELEDGTRELGFWVDGREATVRVELR
ncbi:MAG: hypothetical protein M1827_003324 [Pycnora praestabilis]|nr:MAG: hypothetical protein M1827_003324 [Pycnora praestabilis]